MSRTRKYFAEVLFHTPSQERRSGTTVIPLKLLGAALLQATTNGPEVFRKLLYLLQPVSISSFIGRSKNISNFHKRRTDFKSFFWYLRRVLCRNLYGLSLRWFRKWRWVQSFPFMETCKGGPQIVWESKYYLRGEARHSQYRRCETNFRQFLASNGWVFPGYLQEKRATCYTELNFVQTCWWMKKSENVLHQRKEL